MPNEYGGRENLDAVSFLQEINATCYKRVPGIMMIAEESTAWPGVTRPIAPRRARLRLQVEHGLDERHARVRRARPDPPAVPPRRADVLDGVRVLGELRPAALARRGRARQGLAAGQDARRRVAAVRRACARCSPTCGRTRASSCCSWAGSSASRPSGRRTSGLDWWVLEHGVHSGRAAAGPRPERGSTGRRPPCGRRTPIPDGFSWIDANDAPGNVFSFLRFGTPSRTAPGRCCRRWPASPTSRRCRTTEYRIGLPRAGRWREVLNTDAAIYGGSGVGNLGAVHAVPEPWHGRPASATIAVPPLGALWLAPDVAPDR